MYFLQHYHKSVLQLTVALLLHASGTT